MEIRAVRSLVAALVGGGLLLAAWGCTPEFFANQFEERDGSIGVLVNNNTDYRATISMGSWDPWDRNPPGPVDFDQRTIEPRTSTPSITLDCQRAFSVGTDEFIARALAREVDDDAGVTLDALTGLVHFSDAPEDSPAAVLPTVGTAEGREFLLGVDYRCLDTLIITLLEDPNAPGGFRIGYELLESPPEDN